MNKFTHLRTQSRCHGSYLDMQRNPSQCVVLVVGHNHTKRGFPPEDPLMQLDRFAEWLLVYGHLFHAADLEVRAMESQM